MNATVTWIKSAAALIGGLLAGFLGGLDGAIYTLITFMVIDYITGIIAAVIEQEVSSEIGAKGIVKKIVILMIVGIANLLDQHIIGGGNGAIRSMVIFFYLANEGISVLENSVVIGLPVPQKLKDMLLQLREDNS